MWDVAGHIGHGEYLNDAVLVYSLRQMASDYQDVCVFDSIVNSQFAIPSAPMNTFRWIFFPVNFSNVHWTIICVGVSQNGLVVQLYDPLQTSRYEDELQQA